jgi:antitoxin VapB
MDDPFPDLCQSNQMTARRHLKLLGIGRHQAIRIPRAFELPGQDAIMHRHGDRLIIKAAPGKSLLGVLAALSPIDETFPEINDPAPDPVEL